MRLVKISEDIHNYKTMYELQKAWIKTETDMDAEV